ncbi:3-keto-5-aminohexanoate cleavage protein [Mesorhizobium sp. B2-4-17]|uniref:3-keto-5-aminohexanoate cleavage protein n=1 Tax=Mesorhizobium sp. B2-4-17 TaxID=2589932 RepID=UPI00112B5E8C|nr:3-keto-5-aminohexanoate cleavage protein [Mesorhizobium sp. B2-4-17]TPK75312.1 3-keto-5-aminohexanoate cleavage protein [Mesorhizobium sp. B2-4-17]
MRSPLPKIVITCAITGNLTKPEQTPHLPITPQQIAASALAAAEAGAAVVHIHVRDPRTGRPSMELELYREVLDLIRGSNPELIINLTTGPGGRFVPSQEDPRVAGPGTTLLAPERRVEHIAALKPDICTLDLNTMNSGGEVVINTPGNVRRMAKVIAGAGVRPEIELFDSGDIALLADLLADGTLQGPPLTSLIMGVRYGFQPSPETVVYARNLLPPDAAFTAIGIGRSAFQMVAQSYLAGGHVRVGLEDAIYLDRGVLAPSNAAMVEKARRIVEDLGGKVADPREARAILGLPAWPANTNRVA